MQWAAETPMKRYVQYYIHKEAVNLRTDSVAGRNTFKFQKESILKFSNGLAVIMMN